MTKLTILIFFMTIIFSGNSQIIVSRVDKYVAQSNIDTFLVYSFPCSGYINFDSCHYEESQYLIWKQQESYFLKKFAYCKTSKTLKLDTFNPLVYYLDNKKVIDYEEIKQPTYFDVRKTRKTVDTLMVTSSVSHSCYHKFHSPLMDGEKYKYADTYDLTFKTFDDGIKNIYYEANLKTRFKSLIDLTSTLIKQLEIDNRFTSE